MTKALTPPPTARGRTGVSRFRSDVVEGLSRQPKQLPSKYFYDRRGSALFDAICELPEYYLTRTEAAIMRDHVAEMAEEISGDSVLIELGSGSSTKTRLLLDRLPSSVAYVPIDISGEHLTETADRIRRRYRRTVLPVIADFSEPLSLPSLPNGGPRTVYFPGSTIGNFEPHDAQQLLRRIAGIAGRDGKLLIGIDLHKDPAVIEPAYNDAQGVTAEFNLNLLHRINRELDGSFDEAGFVHEAAYDSSAQRVEMRLRSVRPQVARVAGECFTFAAGEAIRTEYSHKYTIEGFAATAADAGLALKRHWVDDREYFAVLLLQQ